MSKITDRSIVRRVVNHDIVARLKEAHLANLFRPDARGSYVRDGARRKFNPRIRGVNSIRENGNTDGVHVGNVDIAANQPLDNVEIVNHQIEHDVDVQRARRELSNAMNFEIDGIAHMWAQRNHRRIEALSMANL